ncbi:MAG: hypothetical protein JOZ53_26400 [Planctomycetaceae bacterium]|nr:hypothetical protein [Planctomycetaceae bacterium]
MVQAAGCVVAKKKHGGGRPKGLGVDTTSVRLGAETVRRAHVVAASRGESLAVFLDGIVQAALREHEAALAARLASGKSFRRRGPGGAGEAE